MSNTITIKVRIYHKHFKGDNSSHIEWHEIKASALGWWKQHSGNGSFDLISYY